MLAKISSRSNSSSDVWRDGDEAVSPPALLCCAAVKESSSACAGDGVARAGDGGGVPSRERRRGDPSVEDGVTDRARRAAAACWSGSAALKDWVESSMARPGFTSERRAQSVEWGQPARAGGLSGRRRSAISYQRRPRSASWESLWGSPSPAGACKSFPAGSTVASASAYGRIYGPRALPAPRFARAPRPSIEALVTGRKSLYASREL